MASSSIGSSIRSSSISIHETARDIPRRTRLGQADAVVPKGHSSLGSSEGVGRDGTDSIEGHTRNPDSLPSHSTLQEYAFIEEVRYRNADKLNALLSSGDVDSFKALLADGKNINIQDRSGNTPLNRLCRQGNLDLIEWVLVNGASPNIKNDDGSTPLATAIYNDRPDVVSALLQHGANLEIKDKIGMTPLDLAHGYGRSEITKILSQHQEMETAPERPRKEMPSSTLVPGESAYTTTYPRPAVPPRGKQAETRSIARSYDSFTVRYAPSGRAYYYRHHPNDIITSHWVASSSDEQDPKVKDTNKSRKSHHQHGERSQRNTKASKSLRVIGERYSVTRARAASPGFEKAFQPRKFGIFGKYDKADKKDRIWNRWADLKPHKGDKVSDDHGRRFQCTGPAPSRSGQSTNQGLPGEGRKFSVFADSAQDDSRMGEAKRLQEESDRKLALKFQGMEVTKRIQDGFSKKFASDLQEDQAYAAPSQPVAPVNQPNYREPSARDVLTNPAYQNFRHDAREDIARYNNPLPPADDPEEIIGLTLTETEIRELYHIFQGHPAGDELLRERLRDVVQREFLRIGPGDPREAPRQSAAVPATLRSGHLPQASPIRFETFAAQVGLRIPFQEVAVGDTVLPREHDDQDDEVFNFELNDEERALPVLDETLEDQSHRKLESSSESDNSELLLQIRRMPSYNKVDQSSRKHEIESALRIQDEADYKKAEAVYARLSQKIPIQRKSIPNQPLRRRPSHDDINQVRAYGSTPPPSAPLLTPAPNRTSQPRAANPVPTDEEEDIYNA